MSLNTASMKASLQSCVTRGDAYNVFDQWPIEALEHYTKTMSEARKLTELTMRDEFLLNTALQILDKINGTIKDPVRPNGPQ